MKPVLCLMMHLAFTLSASAQGLAPETLKRIKNASVYIIVTAEKGSSSGSGFVVKQDGDDLYIVTNDHVIDPDHRITATGAEVAVKTKVTIRVVFDSGTPTERVAKASVVAADPDRDLAVLKVSKVKDPPEPLDLADPPPLMETMRLFVCGFPFGGKLVEGKNPEITINGGGVSSIRKDATGRTTTVQIDGSLNPGNSGGPVVSATDGKLVGVAVRSILNSGIGEAVPQFEVVRMLAGRPGRVSITPLDVKTDGSAQLRLRLIDPLKTVKNATAHYRQGRPSMKSDGDKPTLMPGSKKVELLIANGVATGVIEAPAQGKLFVQIEMEVSDGPLTTTPLEVNIGAASPPMANPDMVERPSRGGKPAFRARDGHWIELPAFPLHEKPKSSETALNLSDLSLKPETFIDKNITVEGLCNCQLKSLPTGSFEIVLLTEAGNAPANVRIVLPKDLGLQLSEVFVQDGLDFAYGLRVEGRVVKPARGSDPYDVEANELHFLDQDGTSIQSLKPAATVPGGEATLSVVNRFPADFKGKPVSFKAHLAGLDNAERGLVLKISHASINPVRNLKFYVAQDLATQIANDVSNDGAMVGVEGTLESVDAKAGFGVVAVTGVTVLDAEGKEKKKLAGKEKINLPISASIALPKVAGSETAKPTPEITRRTPQEPKVESSSLMLYLGIGGGAGLLILGAGVLLLLKRRSGAAPTSYQRKSEAVRKLASHKPALIPSEAPKPKPSLQASQPPKKRDDNPFTDLG